MRSETNISNIASYTTRDHSEFDEAAWDTCAVNLKMAMKTVECEKSEGQTDEQVIKTCQKVYGLPAAQ